MCGRVLLDGAHHCCVFLNCVCAKEPAAVVPAAAVVNIAEAVVANAVVGAQQVGLCELLCERSCCTSYLRD
jgi:hypothetical protein